uniref:T9SS type A sorting domain-containing protein n=1 Tax=candidate division WOR-3 bacterium TaxID=2052148 RepID=A0A7C4X970_UNCW3
MDSRPCILWNGHNILHRKCGQGGIETLRCQRQVATLVNENQNPGYYQVNRNIRSVSEKQLPNGVYFYRLTAGDWTETKKMVIVR